MSAGDLPRDALERLFAYASGLQTVWAENANPQLGATGGVRAWVELSILSSAQKGQAEYRTQPAENPLALEAEVVTFEYFTVTARAKSFDAKVQAYDVLRRVRWRIRTKTARSAYTQGNFAFVKSHPIAVVATKYQGRTRLDASLDIVFAIAGGGQVDDDPGATVGTINRGTGPTLTFT